MGEHLTYEAISARIERNRELDFLMKQFGYSPELRLRYLEGDANFIERGISYFRRRQAERV